ncbi:AsmA family protein [Sphingomonas sp. S-NIH.Pt15_0812]|uniref:AsmA family protein n=1 Tax=Sphingomonas sp. S-NIH.Pt15_0812 TaxID=1920129 RepID=UPI000F7F1CD8|nr:AsmA family protein [Sphingomonas sp. S-NIH.Pt15_0812]RSU54085.1 AsmA family protein [Sphingomonas sp. S-NIH.Pt15_0812]
MDQAAPSPDVPLVETQRRRRRILRNTLIAVAAVIFGIWLLLFVTKGRFLRHPFERFVAGQTHRAVKVDGDFQLYFAPFRIKLYAERFTLANPAWATRPNLFQADRIDARIAPLSLLFGKRRLYSLDLANGAADLEWNAAHTTNSWTFSDQKGGKPLEFPRIDTATVTGTTVRYRDPRMRLLADLSLDDIRSNDARIGRAVGVTGKGVIRDTPFRLAGRLLSPDATANRGKNQLVARMWAVHNVIDVSGTLPSIADIENVPLQTRASGRNLRELLGIIGVYIPQTRRYRLHAQLVKSGDEYRFTRMAGRFGDSDISGRFTVTQSVPKVHIGAELRTRSLDIVDVAPFIGYNPDIVATRGAVAAAAATGAAPARLLPDAPLDVAAMRAFNADAHWTVGMVKSRRIPIADIDLTVKLKDSVLTLSPLTMALSRGNVASDVRIDTNARPADATYDIRLAPTPLGKLLAGWGVIESGTSGTLKGRIELRGRGDTIHDSLATAHGRMAFIIPQGTLWTRNVQLAELDLGTFVQKMFEDKLKKPVEINCGLVAFTVRNGIAAADPILIDTSKNVITGKGGFSFKTEAVDLAFRADGKKFSLFSGQSPVGIRGYFAQPALQVISPQLLGRAGAGLGLALLATPPAAILAFVDIGDAKSAACGPVLSGATASAQRTAKGQPRDDLSNQPAKSQRKKFLGIF